MFSAVTLLRISLLVSAVSVATVNAIQVNSVECGTVNLYREAVLGGKKVIKDEWPFIVALYYFKTFQYFCGGTIISQKHVLTAAHCIQTKGTVAPFLHDEITVRLGAYNLTDRSEESVVDRNVTQIHVHPDWNVSDERYDADIAILVLNENVTFSNHVRPVCMPPRDFLIDGLNGIVIGWGRTENGTAEGIPRRIESNALNDEYCYETDKGIARYASERSFCGEGSGTPNDGDSGGGFFAVAGSGWVQFGTVSFVRPEATGNVLKIALYMKLTSLRDWIADTVKQSGSEISLATTKADLNCTYEYTSDAVYGCWLHDLNIRQGNFEVETVTGSHKLGKDNEDVELIAIETGVMASLPRNFGNIFKNLKFLNITVDTRRIFRSSLQNLERLERIRFVNSSIAELDEDSLWDLPNLQSFLLANGKLKLLHAETFRGNLKLSEVYVLSSTLKSLPRNLFRNNFLLQFVYFDDNSIETIDDRIFETNANLIVVSLKGNRIRHLNENLFRNNSELRVIHLSNNRIKTIDEQSFKANTKLSVLSLHSNELEFLPAQLLRGMTFLEEFFAEKNALKAVDEQFFETNVGMKTIFLELNRLTRIPGNLFRNNSRLQFLSFGANYIETIDENVFEKNLLLQKVFLQINRIVKLPWNLFRHNSMLEHVNIFSNLLETIDERTFEWNTRLREIDFSANSVSILPRKLFQNNVLLETIYIGVNSLREIDEHTFRTNTKLHAVDLASNLLNSLSENLFRNNPLLKIVDLSRNFFTTLNENVFSSNTNLEKIALGGGMLQSLPSGLFKGNSRLKYIDLHDSSLQIIETSFTELKHVNYINLAGNICVDIVFYSVTSDIYKLSSDTRRTKNLKEFQDIVTPNC